MIKSIMNLFYGPKETETKEPESNEPETKEPETKETESNDEKKHQKPNGYKNINTSEITLK